MQASKKPPEKKKGPGKKDAIATAPEHNLPAPLINSMEDLYLFSQAVFKSNMYAGIKNPESAMVRIQAGRELGLQPMMALNKIHVTKNNDIIIATAVLGSIAMDQGVRWEFLQNDIKACKLRIYRLDGSIPEHTTSFTMEDATRANLHWKDNWKMYPEEMLFNRCLSKGLRKFDPRIGAGFYTKEEMEDVDHFGTEVQGQVPKDQDRVGYEDEEDVQDAEIVEEEEDRGEAVDDAMEDPGEQPLAHPKQRVKKPEPTPPAEDDNPKFTAELRQKEEHITEIKKRLSVLKLDPADFKLYLHGVQKTKVFVGENQHGHLSFHSGATDAIAFLENNTQRVFNDYVNVRFKSMKVGEKIGCFAKPEPADA